MVKKLQLIRLILATAGLVFIIYASLSGNEMIGPHVNGIFILMMSVFTMLLSAEMKYKNSNSLLTYFLFFFSIAMFYVTLKTQFN